MNNKVAGAATIGVTLLVGSAITALALLAS